MRKLLFPFIVVFLFAACKKENLSVTGNKIAKNELNLRVAESNIAILEHKALPSETDPNIHTSTLGNPTQYAYLPVKATLRKDKLFIFIPGTTATPGGYLKIAKAAAQQGYYSFGVAYSNLFPIEFYEGTNPNDNTVENILDEYLEGIDVSPKVNISRANSFENRIIKMILYLDANYPAENWKRFLNANNEICWDKLSVAGHSQGSDHAMYMSKARSVLRAGFFGGPGSFKLNNGQYPTFMQEPGVTPDENLYGFNHTKDLVRQWADVRPTWEVLGLPGMPNSVDDRMVNGAHKLTTSLQSNDAHSAIVSDSATPNDANGNPLYEPVWDYMCFPR
ncbi:MAG: hypothetical protein ABJA79_02175 [Parafilimonas sp.]